jgi:hexosaminidase
MQSKIVSFLISWFLFAAVGTAVNIIPFPQSVEMTKVVFNKAKMGKIKYVKDKKLPAEGYELRIKKNGIIVRSSDEAGRFYALQTLKQLSEEEVMFCGTIKDEPRFEWRGFMLDEARHFFGKEQVKKVLDMMARYKLNRFHWHLSDEQGWRIEIKAYPKLCTVGGIGCHTDSQAPAKYNTQDEIREILAYAAERHIEVIPEIDMPGHA